MSVNIITIGIIIILIGFLVIIVGSLLQSKGKTEGGFVAFIGPIPIGWSTSKNMLYLLIILSLIVALIFLLPIIRGLI